MLFQEIPLFFIFAGFPAIKQCSSLNSLVTTDANATIQSFGTIALLVNTTLPPIYT